MKKGNFGETLRREREMRGVSLEEVASATRITTRNLEALENERWEQLPGGVFNRGFIRSVSRYLGLDEEILVAEYVIATNDQPNMAVWADKTEANKRSPVPWVLGGAAALVLLAAFFLWRDWALVRAAITGAQPATAANAAPPAAPPASQAPPLAAPPVVAEPETLELKVDAGRATQVKIVADGYTVFEGRLEARESRKFRAKEKFEVSARDSLALLMELNGHAVPPLGQAGEAGSLTLTRKDLKKPEGQN